MKIYKLIALLSVFAVTANIMEAPSYNETKSVERSSNPKKKPSTKKYHKKYYLRKQTRVVEPINPDSDDVFTALDEVGMEA